MTKRAPHRPPILMIVVVTLSCFACTVLGAWPPEGGEGFGCFYHETFGNTVVYARCNWLTFWYVYSGFEPMMPPPKWVQLQFSVDYLLPDEVEVQLDGRTAFHLGTGPYFGATPAQIESMLAAKTVVIEARYWKGSSKPQRPEEVLRRERMGINPSHREFLNALAQFARDWAPPKEPWMIPSSVGYIIDLNAPMEPRFKQVREMIGASIAKRSLRSEHYCMVAGGREGPRSSPEVPHHVALYDGDNPRHRAQAQAFLESLAAEKEAAALDVSTALEVALNQRICTVVLFTGGGAKLDVNAAASLLRRHTARLFVVWCADEKADPEGRGAFKKLCEMTGGAVVNAP
jgi:hypothetical protein